VFDPDGFKQDSPQPIPVEMKVAAEMTIDGDVVSSSAKFISRGLGDTIAKVTKAVGIKPCAGCKKRQTKLNELVPYEANDEEQE